MADQALSLAGQAEDLAVQGVQTVAHRARNLIDDKYRLGIYSFLASESVFFIVLLLAFVFYRNSPANRGGPTPFNSLDVGRTAIFSVLLYLSSVTNWLATRSHKKGDTTWWRNWLLLTIALGATFIYGEVSEYYDMAADLHIVPSSDVFATTFYSLTGFHGLHVLTGLLMLSILFVLTLAGKFSHGAHEPAVMVISVYWHFVDAVWLVIFPTVYLWSLAGH